MIKQRYMPSIGATQSFPGMYPPELVARGIRERNPSFHTLLGTTASAPTHNLLALGMAWDDHHSQHTDEHIVTVDGERLVLSRFEHGTFDVEDERYRGYFRGNKDYLRT